MNVLEVKSEDGSDAKYNVQSRVVTRALHMPTRTFRLHGDSMNTDSKSSSLAPNSSKSRTRSPIDEVAERYREDLVEFFERERESCILLCEKLGKKTDDKRERLRLLKEVRFSRGSM